MTENPQGPAPGYDPLSAPIAPDSLASDPTPLGTVPIQTPVIAPPSPVGPAVPAYFEFPADPAADIPVPATSIQAPVAPSSWGTPPPSPSTPAQVFAPPDTPQALSSWPEPTPVAPPAPVPPLAAPVNQFVEPVTQDDVTAILGFDPDALTAAPPAPMEVAPPAALPAVVAPIYLAPGADAAPSVPVYDPRAGLLPEEDLRGSLRPKEELQEVEGRPAIERLLAGLVVNGGSDMHLAPDQPPRYRVHGSLLPIAGEPALSSDDIERLLAESLSVRAWDEYQRNGDLDTAYSMAQASGAAITSRFRVNAYRELGGTGCVFRVIPTDIVDLDTLGIPPQVKDLAGLPRGLVLVCGPTGSGKSTTMAGLVDLINSTRDDRIFTLEDPVEFVHYSKKCLISHREVGEHTPTFTEGLRRVRREDPDVILIGEMRDYETIGAAIEAADTGHLVIATLHTNSAPETISRIINSFPAERQDQIRVTLSSTLKAVLCQTLVPSPSAARGRVVACEIMMVTPGIANNIRQNDIPAIANSLTDTSAGSISLDAHLVQLLRENKISKKEALKKASSPGALDRQLGSSN